MPSPRRPSSPAPRVSLLTPPGIGAIAVIRLEGAGADRILQRLFHARVRSAARFRPGRIVYGELRDEGQLIDEVLVAPPLVHRVGDVPRVREMRAFDLCAHGGLRVVERIVMALTEAGATWVGREEAGVGAWPAASVLEREIWEALARARTRRAVRFLVHQRTALPGELRRIARTAAQDAKAAGVAWQALLDRARAGRLLIEGAVVALVGPANAGKSTLANRLLGMDRSLVSPCPGTTLDWVEQETALEGIPVTLLDTPGYGQGGGVLDGLAAARARERAASADLHLRVLDGSRPPPEADAAWNAPGPPALLVLNKRDLGNVWTAAHIAAQHCAGVVSVSATQGTHLDRLTRKISCTWGLDWTDETVISFFTERQIRLAGEWLGAKGDPSRQEAILAELIGKDG
ncbi:MAG: GTPase [Planctomycetota bacterium]